MLIRRALRDPVATEVLGAGLAAHTEPGTLIFLQGPLGAGKTTLARGFLRRLGHTSSVKSPSFALVETYELAPLRVFHFDLYRMRVPAELESIGFRDYFDGNGICLIEWPERGGALLGQPDLRISLTAAAAGRNAELESYNPRGERLITKLDQTPARDS